MSKKYELTEKTIQFREVTLHRIIALKDFSDVKKGDLGGWVEKEYNLDQEGNCWVYDEAKVFDNASISENAKIYNYVIIYDVAYIMGDAEVHYIM